MTTTTSKAQPNEHGVTWASSRSGKLRIAVGPAKVKPTGWEVWALYTGTHDLAPVSRHFATEAEARTYANQLWRNR